MEVVRQQTETKKINSEEHGVVLEQDFDPFFAVVVVLASQRIVAKQKATPDDAADDMHDGGFVG